VVDRYPGPRTLPALLAWRADHDADRSFLRCGEETRTFADMDRQANRSANALAGLGVVKGDRVAILLENCLEYVDVWFGLARLGALEVPLNTAYRPRQLLAAIEDMEVSAVVTDRGYLASLGEGERASGVTSWIIVDDGELPAAPSGTVHRWSDLLAGAVDSEPAVEVSPADPVAIMLTSGTTSASKGVLVCHEHEFTVSEAIGEHLGLTADDVFFDYFPLFHNTSQGMIIWAALSHGAQVVLGERFSGSTFWADVERYGCTTFFVMGPIVDFLLAGGDGPAPGPGEHTLRAGWGIGFGEEQAARFLARFGIPLLGGYGSTEANLVCLHPPEDPRLDTVGKPRPEFEVAVVDEQDVPVPAGTTGEIVVRPRRPFTTFLGYYNRPAETVEAWRNCWIHTGDAGRFDDDGYLHFVDRVKDVIRRRGENISSFEVESVVRGCGGVADCAAVAVPAGEGRHDDEVYLAVIAGSDGDPSPTEIIERCVRDLPYFAVPRFVEVWTELPRTPTGKVQKNKIRERGVVATTWDREAAGITVGAGRRT
jgi:carnitine-CoA ligase